MKYNANCVNAGDSDLLFRLRQNKPVAFELFYKKYWQRLLVFSMRYIDDLSVCEDIVQELLIKFYTDKYFLKIKTSLSAYLHTALKNRILNHLRKQATYKKHVLVYCSSSLNVEEADKKSLLFDFEKTIHTLLGKLPEKYRDVYILRYDHALTIKNISAVLNRPVNTVEKQSRKVISFLKENLISFQN